MNASLTTQLFALLSTQINAARTGLGLPALSDGGIVFGHEVIPTRSSPPRITADLKDIRTETARHFGASLTSDGILGNNTASLWWRQWLHVEFHLWGNPDVTGVDRGADLDACFELMREVEYALLTVGEGIPNTRILAADFVQPTDLIRNGRLLVLSVEIAWNLSTDTPFTELAFATPTVPGVTIDAVVSEQNPVTSALTPAGTIVAPP